MAFPTWSKPYLPAPRLGHWDDADVPLQDHIICRKEVVFQGDPVLFWAGFGKDGRSEALKQSHVALAIDQGRTVAVFRRDGTNPKAWEPVPFLGTLDAAYKTDGSGLSGGGCTLVDISIKRVGRKLLLVCSWRLAGGGGHTVEIADIGLDSDEHTMRALHGLGTTALAIAERTPRAVAPVDTSWDASLWPAFLPRCMFDASAFRALQDNLKALATTLHHQCPDVTSVAFTPRTESNVAYVYGSQNDGNLSALLERMNPGSTTKCWQILSTGAYVRLMPACTLIAKPATGSHGLLHALAMMRAAGIDPATDLPRR